MFERSGKALAGLLVALSLLPTLAHAEFGPSVRWYNLVPAPSEQRLSSGIWTMGTELVVDWTSVPEAEKESLAERLDLLVEPLRRSWRSGTPGDLSFVPNTSEWEYTLAVSQGGLTVASSVPEGRYNALLTLTQLLPPAGGNVQVACGEIRDRPAFSWRGLMLDSSRHKQSVATIQWVLERMALHKLNRFHWHLTDDQGWRLPVRGWPRLTEFGSWRVGVEGAPYGGAYSEDDIRSIVSYASRRHIVVVPEVDLPGHASAALAAYPELSATGAARDVPLDWGVADGVLSLGRRTVDQFVTDVLDSLKDLFPGPWIHWGGDEVYRTPWMRNAESLAWMKSHRLTTPEAALAFFWADLARKTVAAGKTPIGWDEVALMPIPSNTLIQWWDDPPRGLRALRSGQQIISSWKEASYLDYPEWDGDGDRAFWMPPQTLETIARHPFWPPGTPLSLRKQVLGIEAGLWTERVTEGQLGRKLFPRLSLVADLAWTGVQGGAPRWRERIEAHRTRLEAWGVGMFPTVR